MPCALNVNACAALSRSLSPVCWKPQGENCHVATLEESNIRLFVARQELRGFVEASADARKSAREPGAEFTPEIYLSLAADIDVQVAAKRQEITELEADRAKLL